MSKEAELYMRLDQEMLDALDDEAEKIGEKRSTVARMMLREVLVSRGHFSEKDAHIQIARKIARRSK